MSEPLRIALVAEGPTDQPLIAAALNAILPSQPFVLTQLQPEPTYPQLGTGWGGVLKWCHAAGARHTGPIDSDPTLELYDLLIIHLDLDVCGKQYADYPQLPDDERRANWGALPIHSAAHPSAPARMRWPACCKPGSPRPPYRPKDAPCYACRRNHREPGWPWRPCRTNTLSYAPRPA